MPHRHFNHSKRNIQDSRWASSLTSCHLYVLRRSHHIRPRRNEEVMAELQADFDLYYPTTRISRRSVTYFPSPLTPKADWPKLPWRRGWTIHRRKSPAKYLLSSLIPSSTETNQWECLIGWATADMREASRNQPPKVKVDEDPWAKESRYRRFWAKEQRRRAKAMRQAGICLVSVCLSLSHNPCHPVSTLNYHLLSASLTDSSRIGIKAC